MRALFILTVTALAPLMSARDVIRVDGVSIYGRIHEVTRADIRAAIADCSEKPTMIEVISKTEMRAYGKDHDRGWTPCRRCYSGDSAVTTAAQRSRPCWGCVGPAIFDIREALPLIRRADEVHVFQVTVTANRRGEVMPHGDYKHARLIDADARRKLGRLLGKDGSWCHCADHTFGIEPEPKYVGFIFQRGKDKLILLRFLRWHTEGTFNGEHTSGSLEEKASDELDEWEKRYARPERGFK